MYLYWYMLARCLCQIQVNHYFNNSHLCICCNCTIVIVIDLNKAAVFFPEYKIIIPIIELREDFGPYRVFKFMCKKCLTWNSSEASLCFSNQCNHHHPPIITITIIITSTTTTLVLKLMQSPPPPSSPLPCQLLLLSSFHTLVKS